MRVMPAKKKRFTQRDAEDILYAAPQRIAVLLTRAQSHIPFEITDAQALMAFVHEEDISFVRRSRELYGRHVGGHGLSIRKFPAAPCDVHVLFSRSLGWMPPDYLIGEICVDGLPPTVVPFLTPFVEQAAPFYEMAQTSRQALDELRELCGSQLNRMLYLWPAFATLMDGCDLTRLPAPRGAPSLTPELRQKLETATTFINTVNLMPPERSNPHNIAIWLA